MLENLLYINVFYGYLSKDVSYEKIKEIISKYKS